MNIFTAIHGLAESGAGRVKTLQDQDGEKRLRVGDHHGLRSQEDLALRP